MYADAVDGLMAAKVEIEHNSAGWIEIFKSAGMQAVVDSAGQRIASEAGDNFSYSPAENNQFTVAGFVSGNYAGNIEEATDKTLSKAVHR